MKKRTYCLFLGVASIYRHLLVLIFLIFRVSIDSLTNTIYLETSKQIWWWETRNQDGTVL
ncbi:hypothetical protein AY599_02340 [Leptolyngbya valderiana BDU 20041]|nr:hypothetical protein AY599_02340 [Leptolyngbya valderiana BDU 20041]